VIEEENDTNPGHNKEQEENDHVEITNFNVTNIYDPSKWNNIDNKFRDLIVEKGPIRYDNFDFPKDENNRHFSKSFFTQTLSNGEKHDRKWLVYSNDLDKVYCFCCKLFNLKSSMSQLIN
jgi:hypothetical protein